MLGYSIEVVQSVIVICAMIAIRLLSRSAISRSLRRFKFSQLRRKAIIRLINFFVMLVGIVLLLSIWGIDQKDLLVFISSALTVLGIAFFAQWSLLSNLSAAMILFFNHPLRMGQQIKIHDKEYPIEGTIKDIGYFFVHIETLEGEVVTIPNSVLLQKIISVK